MKNDTNALSGAGTQITKPDGQRAVVHDVSGDLEIFLSNPDPETLRFYRHLANGGDVFLLESAEGWPVWAPDSAEIILIWSARRRALDAQATIPELASYSIRSEIFDEFLEDTLPWLEEQNLHVGINWDGRRPSNWFMTAQDCRTGFEVWSQAGSLRQTNAARKHVELAVNG